MPKYYCEYCDINLTHSSPAGRRQHNSGRRHINNKIEYFQKLLREPGFKLPAHVAVNFSQSHMMLGLPGGVVDPMRQMFFVPRGMPFGGQSVRPMGMGAAVPMGRPVLPGSRGMMHPAGRPLVPQAPPPAGL